MAAAAPHVPHRRTPLGVYIPGMAEPVREGPSVPVKESPRPTEDEVLLNIPVDAETLRIRRSSDSWRVLRILGEFVWGFENLQDVAGGVSIFGSARTLASAPMYAAAEETAATSCSSS